MLRDDGKLRRTLHPGFTLELFRDQAEGYYLNLELGRAGLVRASGGSTTTTRRAPGRRP